MRFFRLLVGLLGVGLLAVEKRAVGVFERLAREFLAGLVILLTAVFGGRAVRVGRKIVQFGGALVVLVVGSVVVSGRHV